MICLQPVAELPDLNALTAAGLAEGFAFVARMRDEWLSGVNRFDAPGEVLFTARDGQLLVGVCGLNRDPYTDDPGVGRVRHLYVLPSHRRRGVGRGLVEAVVGHARGHFQLVRLRTGNPGAAAFYERLGFCRTGPSTGATHTLVL